MMNSPTMWQPLTIDNNDVTIEQEKLMNIQIEEVIDEFKSMNNERERRLVL